MSSRLYHVLNLPAEQFHQAFPLIQACGAGLALEQWLDYAGRLETGKDSGAGVLSVQSGDRYIHALAAYEVRTISTDVRVIQAEHFCVLDLLNRSVGPLLLEGLEDRGRKHVCSEVRLTVPGAFGVSARIRDGTPAATLHDIGYRVRGGWMSKKLPPSGA